MNIYKGYEIRQEYDLKWWGFDQESDYVFAGDPPQYRQISGKEPVGPCKSSRDVMAEIDEMEGE